MKQPRSVTWLTRVEFWPGQQEFDDSHFILFGVSVILESHLEYLVWLGPAWEEIEIEVQLLKVSSVDAVADVRM